MAGYITNQQSSTGNFVQQTPTFDVSRLYQVDVDSDEFKELIVQLAQQVNNVSLSLNNKVSGFYLQEEFVNGNLFFPMVSNSQLDLRPNYTKLIYLTNLPAGITTTAHSITVDANTSFTAIYGVANDTIGFNYYPFGWSNGANYLNVRADNTNVIIDNNTGITFNKIYVILKYLKN